MTTRQKGYHNHVRETRTTFSSSLAMLENPEDYYHAFGESSSKSYSFPTEGNLDPPPPPLKRFTKGGGGRTAGEEEKDTDTTRSASSSSTTSTTSSSSTTNNTTTPTPKTATKTFQRYAPPEENTPKAKIPTTATSPSSTYTPPSPPLKRYNLESTTSTSSSLRPTSPTRVRFQADSAGMMMEAPCVRLQPNHFVPLPIPPRNKVVRFQQETSGGPMLDATPSTSVPKPKPVVPLTTANIIDSSTPTTETGPLTEPSATSPTTAAAAASPPPPPSSAFIEGDAAGNLKFQQSHDVPRPQVSPPLRQYYYRPLQFPTDSAGMMMMQPNVVPKPKPIPPLTVDQIKGTDTTTSSSTTTPSSTSSSRTTPTPSSSSSSSQQHKLEDKATPPNDDQYYKAQTKQVTDSGITGQPRQPTLLWEQRQSDYLG
ncbi:hypothetical protein IV203_006366 [Nitzschia inconspicua]|uniref:Uncharacterized protein n=1 Tax=Nitzschia inconspicua TaxID=303405 RepID=A0A9K3KBL9_9STRA|nr:hypothetical protein IV203_006366 [Nitzschia inconspicua]